jgi:hypothetical protein
MIRSTSFTKSIVGINNLDKNNEPVKDFYRKKKPLYDVVFSDPALMEWNKVNGYPTVFILNSKFEIIDIIEGFSSENVAKIEGYIERLGR